MILLRNSNLHMNAPYTDAFYKLINTYGKHLLTKNKAKTYYINCSLENRIKIREISLD